MELTDSVIGKWRDMPEAKKNARNLPCKNMRVMMRLPYVSPVANWVYGIVTGVWYKDTAISFYLSYMGRVSPVMDEIIIFILGCLG